MLTSKLKVMQSNFFKLWNCFTQGIGNEELSIDPNEKWENMSVVNMISVLLNLTEETHWESLSSCATVSTVFFYNYTVLLSENGLLSSRLPHLIICCCAALTSKFTIESHLVFYSFVKYYIFSPILFSKKNGTTVFVLIQSA